MEMTTVKSTEVFYRVITPKFFADLDAGTIEAAEAKMEEFGNVPKTSEYYDYWQEQRAQCYIVKVTETTERM